MDYILENKALKIKINSLGAELTEIINKENGLSYLWDANPKYWKRSSPVLFPNVGKYKDSTFTYNGEVYKQGQHGFARDMEFELLEQKENYISFVLNSCEQTLKTYPFEFSLILAYELIDNEIKVIWKVKNTGDKEMYFAIGAHPAFNVPLVDEKRSDCYLYLKGIDKIVSNKINKDGLSSNELVEYNLDNGYLNISDDLFDADALVIEDQDIKEISITDKSKKPYITVKMDVPLFGIWSPNREAPFVCIEPWYGRCDSHDYCGDITNRKYENKLNSNEVFDVNYSIIID